MTLKDFQRFKGLSAYQEAVFALIAIGQDGGHHPATLASLERKRFIVGRDEPLPGWPPVTVRRYEVPIARHIEWCAWCAAHPASSDYGAWLRRAYELA